MCAVRPGLITYATPFGAKDLEAAKNYKQLDGVVWGAWKPQRNRNPKHEIRNKHE
jgi:hypothetical protein